MIAGYDPYLVALSVAVAILGGYTGFGLAARVRDWPGANRRLLLSGAAVFLAVGIWTMHFVGMMASPVSDGASYVVLPTIVSFLICALVVGVSLVFVSIGEPSELRIVASALLLGTGIVSMHYVGMRGLMTGDHAEHDPVIVFAAVVIAVGTAYGALSVFVRPQTGMRLAGSAIAFGIAVSGMHYTAMAGMTELPVCAAGDPAGGLEVSEAVLSPILALLCFFIAAGFLLFLIPDPRPRPAALAAGGPIGFAAPDQAVPQTIDPPAPRAADARTPPPAPEPEPLPAEEAAPHPQHTQRLPVEGSGATYFVDVAEVRSIKANAHYTLVHDGTRERMSPWSISQAEAELDPARFVRVHRSHLVALAHISALRKEGDGAVVEVDGPSPHLVPVSRSRVADLKARLGLAKVGDKVPEAPEKV